MQIYTEEFGQINKNSPGYIASLCRKSGPKQTTSTREVKYHMSCEPDRADQKRPQNKQKLKWSLIIIIWKCVPLMGKTGLTTLA